MLETLQSLSNGFALALAPSVLFYAFVGCIVGTLVGVLPGVGPLAGISLLLPEINRSGAGFQPEGPVIRAGLLMVKDLGARGTAAILRERERGPFRSLGDFYLRLQGRVTARAIANLIRAGAFDALGPRNAQLLELHTVWTKGKTKARNKRPGQLQLFAETELGPAKATPDLPEYGEETRRELEREVLGCYLNQHPLERYRPLWEGLKITEVEALTEEAGPDQVLLCGLVGGFRSHRTRQGQRMLFATLEDLTGQAELVIFPSVLASHALAPIPVVVCTEDWGQTLPCASPNNVPLGSMYKQRSHARP